MNRSAGRAERSLGMGGALLFGCLFAVMVVIAAACGGGSGSSLIVLPTATATVSATPTPTATPTRVLTICPNSFALCAASTCTATGGTITLNNGQTYPAAQCVCPVLPGPSIADVNAGNMQGSCTPPEGGVWSTYQVDQNIPQAAASPAWSEAPAPFLVCPAGDQYAQCWNFACVLGEVVNDVQLAVCTCPIETSTTDFVSQAGLTGQAACDQIPVGGALPSDSSTD